MRAKGLRCFALTVCVGLLWASAAAAPVDELKGVRERAERLQRQLIESETARDEAADALRRSEHAIGRSNRRLVELEAQRQRMLERLTVLNGQRERLQSATERERQNLATLLRQAYMQGSRASVELAMAGRDPNESGRQATYLGYLYRARTTRIGQLARDTEQLRTVLRETADEAGALAELEAEQSRERATLIAERTRREAALTRLSSEIARQRQQLESLKRDEERLSRLVRKLEQEAAARARAARARSKTGKSARQEKAVPAGLPREAGATRFAKLKGRLHLPLRGELANRFGSPRSDTGLSWNGVFIRASKGTRVRAVADGRIVFADWLRGYGNMLIVDHGEGFMSLYGNNESLLHKPGESVSAGQVVAATGTSSGNPESGLYFEMRFRGKPIDPAVWIELK